MKDKIIAFFEARFPIKALDAHISKPLPKHINLLFSLGSMVMFLLLLQAVTGAFLAFYYSPSPDHAYDSVNYISKEVIFGSFVRGLHHWGASAMVIVTFLHLLRVVIYGSYKAPREITWVIGVLLLLVVLGFGFTGYLLPWDQKAYWATVVGVEISGTAPVVGKTVAKIIRGGDEVGAVTLTRFFALHTIWLPWIAFALVGLHLFFVRHLGSSGLPKNTSEEMQAGKPFYPHQVLEDMVGIAVLFVILASLALFAPVHMEALADPTDATYDPRPEWYFMFLFQLLKYFQGPLEVVGTFVIPTVAITLLLLLPFLDRGERKSMRQRPVALGVTCLSVLLIVTLTILGIRSPKLEASADEASAGTGATSETISDGPAVFDFGLDSDQTEQSADDQTATDTEVFDFGLDN